MPRDDYEERKEEKIEKYKELAAKRKSDSDRDFNHASSMGKQIPLGQPILVGHHSEKGHRAHLKRIDNAMQRGIDNGNKSEYYDNKANAMENNSAISSDDPLAIEKINVKIESEKALHAKAKAKRKEFRDNKDEKVKKFGDRDYWSKYYLLESYMSGYLANIKRLKDRIKSIEAQNSVQEVKIENNGISMEVNKSENRVMIFFPGKPSEEIRSKLKRHGFRWSPRNMAWQAYIKQWNIDFAKEIVQG